MSILPIANPPTGPQIILPSPGAQSPTPATNHSGTAPDLEKRDSFTPSLLRRITSKFGTFTQFEPELPRRAPTIPVVDDYPEGYPRAAGFIASADDFQVYRRYLYLISRLLLHKQAEIAVLEKTLKELDAPEDEDNKDFLADYTFEHQLHYHPEQAKQRKSERIELFEKLEPLLNSYAELLFKNQQLLEMKAPSKTARQSVYTYLTTSTGLVTDQTHYIDHKFDLVSLAPGAEKAWVDDFVACLLRVFGKIPYAEKLFCSAEDRKKARDPHIHYSTRLRVNLFVAVLITILVVTLLVAPVYVLFKITSNENLTTTERFNYSVFILIGATFTMAMMLSMFTRARRHESLAASAA